MAPRLAVLLLCATWALPVRAQADPEDCLARVAALKREVSVESQLVAKVRGVLDEAAELCREGQVEAADRLLEEIRQQVGMAMGK